ncbi:uncharacterized protein LOC111087326 [Limulus polyphemus]|uniref:Uncharacterized protein LOC111087326 n=1 Tax=Limulus polyphemus TaxID=6850 RepID=A0ABM1T093_LIMPO|nr:uncharacterized protein LOC111087326 [Limulus polyphemus]
MPTIQACNYITTTYNSCCSNDQYPQEDPTLQRATCHQAQAKELKTDSEAIQQPQAKSLPTNLVESPVDMDDLLPMITSIIADVIFELCGNSLEGDAVVLKVCNAAAYYFQTEQLGNPITLGCILERHWVACQDEEGQYHSR